MWRFAQQDKIVRGVADTEAAVGQEDKAQERSAISDQQRSQREEDTGKSAGATQDQKT